MIIFLKIINHLGKHPWDEYTMHELSSMLNIPYASFYRYVKRMVEHKVLASKTIGKSKVISLNLHHPIAKAHLTTASYEDAQEYLAKHPIINKITQNLDTKDVVVLFGSYAKRKETAKSDVDILVINKDGKRSLSFSMHELLYKKKINAIFMTRKEFMTMLGETDENLGKQTLKDHIILNNPEQFWGYVLDAIR